MAEVKKARLFLRRGTDTDRKLTTLCEGELGYSTDAFRVVVGDGATAGGRSLGATVFVSAGSLASNFHTKLTTASADGLALAGDFAVFPASAYKKADGSTNSVPSASATNVMLLTGANVGEGTSWVAVNSGIPYGNIDVQDNDISGDYVSGGIITAPITLSGGPVNIGGDGVTETLTLSGVALSAENFAEFTSTKIYPLGITGTAQLTAISGVASFTNAIPDSVGGTNYYWDDYVANGGNDTVPNALDGAIAAHPNTEVGDMMYIRWGWVRNTSGGNGSGSTSIQSVVGFLKHGTAGTKADWVQISRVYHGNSSLQSAYQTSSTNIARWPL